MDLSTPRYIAKIEGTDTKLFFDYPLSLDGRIFLDDKEYVTIRQTMIFKLRTNRNDSYWLACYTYILREVEIKP